MPKRDSSDLALWRGSAWGLMPDYVPVVSAWLAGRIDDEAVRDFASSAEHATAAAEEPAAPIGGVAVIPLYGLITPQGSLLSLLLGGSAGGLMGFREQLAGALANADVSSIVIDIDSPGGLVDLVPETAAMLRAAAGQKKIVAVSNTLAASAAYWLGSQASEFVVTPSGIAGSIGVYSIHDDMSERLAQAGVTRTIVSAGKFKVEGNPYEPLSDEAKAAIQREVDYYYGMFAADVAAGRGTTQAAVEAGYGQGRALTAGDAIAAGIADRVATIEDVVRELASGSPPSEGGARGSEAANAGDAWDFVCELAESMRAHNLIVAGAERTEAKAIPGHNSEVVDVPWDGPGQEKKLNPPINERVARGMYAWYDAGAPDANDDGWPDAKAAYKFPHHQVDASGVPGAANVNGVRAGLSRLEQADIPAGDKTGVRAHLQHHLDAFKGSSSQDAGDAPHAESEPQDEERARRELAELLLS